MEGVDKLLDKLGIYNLIGVLLPGITATGFSILADKIVFHLELYEYLSTEDMFLFLIVSYFVGVLLQEFGSFLTIPLQRGNKVLLKALTPKENRRDSITKQEEDMYIKVIDKSLPDAVTPDWPLRYNFCKYSGGNSSAADKDHSIAAMSRSMGVYFGLLSICLIVASIQNINVYLIIAGCLSGIISILMWYRSFRFHKIRYIRIIRTYYYKYIDREK